MMELQTAATALVVLVLLLIALRLWRWRDRGQRSPYELGRSLLSPAERSFLDVLEQAVGDEYRIHVKVGAAEVIKVRAGADDKSRQRALGHIAQAHFDFVLCTPSELVVMAAVELDGGDGNGDLADICRRLRLPLARFSPRRDYTVSEVRRELMRALGTPAGPELGPLDVEAPSSDSRTPTLPPLDDDEAAAGHRRPPACPACGTPMVAADGEWRCHNGGDCGNEAR